MKFGTKRLFKGRNISAAAAGIVVGAIFLSPAITVAQTATETPPAAGAQTAPAGSWVKLCNKDEQAGVDVCVISQELRDPSTGQLVASVTVREIPEQPTVLIIAVPTGVLLPPGMRVQIDQSEAKPAEYAICFPNACVARLNIDDDYITAMKAGGQFGVTVMGGDRQQVGFPISLVGFTKAYDDPPTDQAEYEQTQRQLSEIIRQRAEAARAAQEAQQSSEETPAPSE